MKTSALLTAQLHRNPHLMEVGQDPRILHDSRRPVRRAGRRRF